MRYSQTRSKWKEQRAKGESKEREQRWVFEQTYYTCQVKRKEVNPLAEDHSILIKELMKWAWIN